MQDLKERAKEKKWILKNDSISISQETAERLSASLRLHPIIIKLLSSRGYTTETEIRSFLGMESEMLCNPFDMKDIDKGVERIHKAIVNGEKITVYGDYDVDGVTSVCTVYLYLKSVGANIDYYIPNRTGEGYGVSKSAIEAIKESGTSLIITVDTGITANDEVKYAKELGVDFVITDHHECHLEIPEAVAVINPHRPDCNYPFKELAGVGVVFKLVSAYEEFISKKSRIECAIKVFREYADLVAIGTIADVMPIKSENRIIVSYGLKMLEQNQRPGLVALVDASNSFSDLQRSDKRRKMPKITSGYIGYTLAPRINAAGRLRSASLAVELLLAVNLTDARSIADELCRANKERQNEENRIMEDAYKKIEELDLDNNPVIVLDANDWHHGVIGIVSSRITEKYSRPSILISFEGNPEGTPYGDAVGKGSGRSISGMNLVEALCHCSEHLIKFGGHELAAGLSVSRSELDNFRKKINEYARANLTKADMIPTIEADCEIDYSDISLSLAQELQVLEPYGVGNPIPTFVMRNVCVTEISSISNGKHTRFSFTDGKNSNSVSAMYFSNSPRDTGLYIGDFVDIVFNLDVNEWLGKRNVQLIIKDIKISDVQMTSFDNQRALYQNIRNGAPFSDEDNICPTREDFAIFYRFVNSSVRSGSDTFTHRDLVYRLTSIAPSRNFGYIKVKIIIKVLQELNIIGIEEDQEEEYRFCVHYSTSKSDLEKSNILKRIKSQIIK